MIKGSISGALLLPVAALLAGAWAGFNMVPAAIAQDALPETSAELRDFKLLPEPPKPKPQPLPPAGPDEISPVTPKIPVPNSETQEPPQTKASPPEGSPVIAPRSEQRSTGTAAKPQAGSRPATGAALPVQAAPTLLPPDQQQPQAGAIGVSNGLLADQLPREIGPSRETGAQDEVSDNQKAAASPPANDLPRRWIWLGLLALAAMIGAVIVAAWIIRNGKKKPSYPAAGLLESDAENIGYETEPTAPLAPVAAPSLPSQGPRTPQAATRTKRAQLEMAFVPGKATISLANLTIEGKLYIENIGDAPAKSMQLRAAIISAGETQDVEIEKFFKLDDSDSEQLDGAEIGEKIALDLNSAVPLSEITVFASGVQKLLVPIILVRISYQWGTEGQASDVQLSCLIGREASPPKPKMGALRLDLGPRSVGSLGQRPIFG
jgi:archaellum component FlaG (FlaF/FlaG flagellin family)